MKKTLLSLLIISIAVAIGLACAWLGDSGQFTLAGLPLLTALALLAFAVQWIVFVPSFALQTEHFYDLTGSLTYLLCIGLATVTALAQGAAPQAILLATLVTIWAIRLGSFLFVRVRRTGKDGRFDEIKPRWARFLVAWTIQGLWVFLTLLAALIAIANKPQALDIWAYLGAAIWLVGFGFEAIADAQKSRFSKVESNRGTFIQQGLWRWSRHPNYFGEIVLWVGIAIIAAPTFNGWQWIGLISPLFVTFLLTRVSGIPLLEQRAEAKWGEDPAYRAYCESTPVLIPRPPKNP